MPTGNTPLDGIIFTVAERGLDKDIWIAIRTDSVWPGKGTFEYPFKVTTSAEFQTVLTNAAAGSTIHVQPGIYPALNLTISKSVTISGSRSTVFTQAVGNNKPIFTISGATTEFFLEGVTLSHGTGFRAEASIAIRAFVPVNKLRIDGIYSSDFANTINADNVNELIVRNSDFVYTYGRASTSEITSAHPCASIVGHPKRFIAQHNTWDGLLDSTFAGVTGSPPAGALVPADNLIQTGNHEYCDISDNTIINHYIEGIRVSRGPPGTTGEVYSCRIADNHLVGSNYAIGDWYYTPAIVVDNYQASITGNTVSNVWMGIQAKFDAYDEGLNVVSITGNTMLHVIRGISAPNTSSRSIFANNIVWNTSEPVRTIYGPVAAPTNFLGISIPRGTVANNVLLADEPVWDASPTLVSRASNVFTLNSVAGIVANTGALVSYDDPVKFSYFPVEGISGNDVTVASGWAASSPAITSGTLYYAQNQPNADGMGGIVVETGGTVYADNNLVIGHRHDVSILNSGTIILNKHATRDCHYVRASSASIIHQDLQPDQFARLDATTNTYTTAGYNEQRFIDTTATGDSRRMAQVWGSGAYNIRLLNDDNSIKSSAVTVDPSRLIIRLPLNVGLTSGIDITRIRHGEAVLVAGVKATSDTTITAVTRIFPTRKTDGGTIGCSYSVTRSAGVSFTITSKDSSGATQTSDTSTLSYMLIEP